MMTWRTLIGLWTDLSPIFFWLGPHPIPALIPTSFNLDAHVHLVCTHLSILLSQEAENVTVFFGETFRVPILPFSVKVFTGEVSREIGLKKSIYFLHLSKQRCSSMFSPPLFSSALKKSSISYLSPHQTPARVPILCWRFHDQRSLGLIDL